MTRTEIRSKGGGQFLYNNHREEFNKLLPSSVTFWTKSTAIKEVKRLIKLGMSRDEIKIKSGAQVLYRSHRDEFNKLVPLSELGRKMAETKARKAAKQKKGKK